MDLNKLTQKSQEALAAAQTAAKQRYHQLLEPEHLLAALLTQPEGVVFPLLQKVGVSPRTLRDRVDELLDRIPKVYGSESEVYLSPALRRLLERADDERQDLGDDYVSTEHLFLALLDEKGA